MAYLKKCKRMTVYAIGMDAEGNIAEARNGNHEECKNIVGACGCIHAEVALLQKMPHPVSVSVSHAPCIACAIALVEAKVKTVTYLKPYRLTEGIEYLEKNGIAILCTGE